MERYLAQSVLDRPQPKEKMTTITCFPSCFKSEEKEDVYSENLAMKNVQCYTYEELRIATDNFTLAKRIGGGGFGSVYKGTLKDGTLAAIKVLSRDSRQGVREFLTELEMIAGVEHENLVKLLGYCAERDERILVYGFLVNNSLAQTLLIRGESRRVFSWSVRRHISIGVAKGLAFLHEEVEPPVVHRDIKASNILLDKHLTPKISDFGLAKLFPRNMTHISTRVAGTAGYLAPEYAKSGHMTEKIDVYSFGVLLLEIVCGRPNKDKMLPSKEHHLLDWVWIAEMGNQYKNEVNAYVTNLQVWDMYEEDDLEVLVDEALGDKFNTEEACRYIQIGLLCTREDPMHRPDMSVVLKMLKGEIDLNIHGRLARPRMNLILKGISLSQMRKRRTNTKSSKCSTSTSTTTSSTQLCDTDSSISHGTMTYFSIYDRSE